MYHRLDMFTHLSSVHTAFLYVPIRCEMVHALVLAQPTTIHHSRLPNTSETIMAVNESLQ